VRRRKPVLLERCDPRLRRRIGRQPQHELIDRVIFPLDFDLDAAHRIAHPAGEAEFGSEAMHERAEADALHGPSQIEAQADQGQSSTSMFLNRICCAFGSWMSVESVMLSFAPSATVPLEVRVDVAVCAVVESTDVV